MSNGRALVSSPTSLGAFRPLFDHTDTMIRHFVSSLLSDMRSALRCRGPHHATDSYAFAIHPLLPPSFPLLRIRPSLLFTFSHLDRGNERGVPSVINSVPTYALELIIRRAA